MDRWKFWMVSFFLWIYLVVLRFELCVSVNEEGKALLSLKDEANLYSLSYWNDNYPDGKVEILNVRKASHRGLLQSGSNVLAPTSINLQTPDGATGGRKLTSSLIASISIGATIFVLVLLYSAHKLWHRTRKGVNVMPWATGLSGKLQKAFVTGTPSLRRSELEVACEDFSNIIGFLSNCSLYKGTLSSGVEIAVTSINVTLTENWSEQYQTQYMNKITVLSKINYKNFMNLIGYCEEEEPFTWMMVFEYAPNGTLFEHLHSKQS